MPFTHKPFALKALHVGFCRFQYVNKWLVENLFTIRTVGHIINVTASTKETNMESEKIKELIANGQCYVAFVDVLGYTNIVTGCLTDERKFKRLRSLFETFGVAFFEAITELSSNPTETQGDTIKRLSGEFAGKWRYRIGEYRLIYLPDLTSHTIVLLAIRPRGEAYD